MPGPMYSGGSSRKITTRIVVEGNLELQTPACFSNGDTDELTDIALLLDPLTGQLPLLPGASIAGALRSYLREREHGYGSKLDVTKQEDKESFSVLLFGGLSGDDEGEQSPLIVDDAVPKEPDTRDGSQPSYGIELRHGVRLAPDSRTAADQALFDLNLWAAGTTFPLRFELLIREGDNASAPKLALATALAGLSDGNITLGVRKSRGYGQVCVRQWRVKSYDLTKPDGLLDWIEHGDKPLDEPPHRVKPDAAVLAALGVSAPVDDHRQSFEVRAEFSLDGSLLVRSGGGQDDKGPDMVHLRAKQPGRNVAPVLSGTSLAGVLRARAMKVARTLGSNDKAQALIDNMFGVEVSPSIQPKASRVIVRETVLHKVNMDLVQDRVSIDRFTGGARESALFNEQPAFGGEGSIVSVELRLIIKPEDYEIGLLLLLLKDLWTGDLALGGESSVGRGRLKGRSATITLRDGAASQRWDIAPHSGGLSVKDQSGADGRAALQKYVESLTTWLKEAKP